jgi:acyl carrier protein
MLDRDAIRQTLINLLHDEIGEDFRNVADAQNLRTELGLDSADVVSVISQIERRYHIRMSREELEKLITVGDVLDLLQAKISDPGSETTSAAAA